MTFNAGWLLLVVSAGGGNSIDEILADTWREADVQPAAVCTDDQFLRRITLDLAGRIPALDEIRRFREHPDRTAAIERLLASDEFPRFWSEVWVAALNGYSDAFAADREVLRAWLEASLQSDVPYDQLVRQLIAARGTSALDGPVNFLVRHPEDPTVKVGRLFLGVRLDCARCHDHPFDRWTQEDYRLMNRFFEATRREEVSEGNIRLANGVPGDDEQRPRFLTGASPRTSQWRDELALFMVNSKPFARTFANRIWYQLLGRGIVHPPDDLNRTNPPAIPRLLEHLADEARAEGFSVREMVRRICNSRAYQLSSVAVSADPRREALFAQRVVRPLTAEQTFDSAVTALAIEWNDRQRRQFIQRTVGQSLDEDFSMTWEYRETVQGLMSRLNADLPVPEESIDVLFLRILSREPTAAERAACRGHAAEDIVFALVNSNEFFFNH